MNPENPRNLTLVVFDLDDTLSITEHRAEILNQEHETEADKWQAFFERCDEDEPNRPVITIYNALVSQTAGSCHVEIWTGRPERFRGKTENWIHRHMFTNELSGMIQPVVLRMRPDDDFRHDTELKGDWLERYGTPIIIFDDRNSVVKFWREQGIVCAQVKESNF